MDRSGVENASAADMNSSNVGGYGYNNTQGRQDHDTTHRGQSMPPNPVLSTNGNVKLRSPVRNDDNEGGGNDDGRSRRSSETQRADAGGEEKKDGERGGGNKDCRRRLVHRLMGSVLVACLLVFTAYLSMVPLLSQYLFRRFAVDHFNLTNVSMKKVPCAVGTNNSRTKDAIDWLQSKTSQQLLYFSLVHSVPAIFVAIFVGSYTDHFGRKFLVLAPMVGGFLKSMVTMLVIYLKLDVELLYLAFALEGVLGSIHVMTLGLFAAIADVTISAKQRVLMFALLEISVALSGAVSQIGTGFLIDALGFAVPSLIITCLIFLGSLCILVFMPETLRTKPERLVLNPLVHLRKVFGFYFLEGTAHKRALFICGQSIVFIVIMINMGRIPVETLFEMQSPLCWGSIKIGAFTGVRMLLQNLVGVGTLKVMSNFVPLEVIAVMGMLSGVTGFIIQSLADVDLMMYISGVVGMWITVVGPIARTLMSRMVPPDRQGALFASLSAVETLCNLTASLVYNGVYSATTGYFPGAVFLLMAALLLADCALLVTHNTHNTLYVRIDKGEISLKQAYHRTHVLQWGELWQKCRPFILDNGRFRMLRIVFILLSRRYPHLKEVQIDTDKADTGASPAPTPPYSKLHDETTRL